MALDAQGGTRWELHALSGVETAAVVPGSDGRVVHAKEARYAVDFARVPGDEAHWSGWTSDVQRYPWDARAHGRGGTPILRSVSGHLLHFDRGGESHAHVTAYRTTPGSDVVAPCLEIGQHDTRAVAGVQIGSRATVWSWQDSNGDGAWQTAEWRERDWGFSWGASIDDEGNIWRAEETVGIRFVPLVRVAADGSPHHELEATRLAPIPSPFNVVERIERVTKGEVLYVAGYAGPKPDGAWGFMGDTLARYDGFSAAGASGPPRWTVRLDGPDRPVNPRSFAVAGGRVFIAYNRSARIFVHDADTGEALGTITSGAEDARTVHRMLHGLAAHQRNNGEILLFEEGSWINRVFMYRIPPQWGR